MASPQRCGEAEIEFVVIADSRGAMSHLVKPVGDGASRARSLARGAARKWVRRAAPQRMRERFSVSELVPTPLGGRMICEARDLLCEEAPAACKNNEVVIADLMAAELVFVIAALRPLPTYKTRKFPRRASLIPSW